MIVLLDTSTPICKLTLINGAWRKDVEWDADRDLARHLLKFLHDELAKENVTLYDLQGIGVMKGPGSFTGLRIGITVLNTIAHTNNISIVGVTGDHWQQEALRRLEEQENDEMVMPEYGKDANITSPRK